MEKRPLIAKPILQKKYVLMSKNIFIFESFSHKNG